MNMELFSEALGNIDSKYIKEVLDSSPPKKVFGHRPAYKYLFRALSALAACLAIVLVLVSVLHLEGPPDTPQEERAGDGDGLPQVTVDGRVYLISPYLAASRECPPGFSLGGTITSGEYASCEYYVNPDFPDWVYVLQETTIGELDENSNTMQPSDPYMGYVRYVNARIRGLDLVCCQNQLYLSMWSASSLSDAAEEFGRIQAQYGIRIEGAAPEGFSLVGTTAFSGFDTVPAGSLSSNTGTYDVYANPDIPDILLVSASWYTAAAEAQGETLHTGFHVYYKYDLPR